MTGNRLTSFPGKVSSALFYGWWIVILGSLINAVGIGIINSGFTVFFLPLKRELALSSAAVSLLYGASRLEGGIEGPIVGYLINRIGPRKMIFAGSALAGAGLILFSRSNNFLTLFVVYVLIVAVGYNAGFIHPVTTVANHWFIRKRSTAFGILTAAGNFGGMIMVPVLSYFTLTYNWRLAAVIGGAIILVVCLPSTLIMHRSPEERGLLPDGGPPRKRVIEPAVPLKSVVNEANFTIRESLKTFSFWLLTLCVSLRILVSIALSAHLIPVLVWRGMGEAGAAYLVSLYSLLSIIIMMAMGWIGDRLNKQMLCSLGMLATAVCLLVPTFISAGASLYLIPIGLALAMGTVPLNWALVSDFFGRHSYAGLRGIMGTGTGIATFISPIYAGWMYDRTGSYTIVLITFAVLLFVTAGLFAVLRRPKPPEKAATG